MNTLPVVERELRLRARQRGTYWLRCGVAAIAVMIALQETVLPSVPFTSGTLGAATFAVVSWVAFLVACGSAFATADVISRERRDGTLGLLLLTKLKGYDVVLGKLCASGLMAYYALLGFVPAMGLVVLSGGISGGQFARTALALMDAAFLALAVGLWVSSRAQTRANAMRGVVLVMVLFSVLPRILTNLGRYVVGSGGHSHLGQWLALKTSLLAAFAPYTTFYYASDKMYLGDRSAFWVSLIVVQLEAWLLLHLTAARLMKNWRAVEWAPKPRPPEWEPVFTEEAKALAADRAALLQSDPVCWAVSRMRIQSAILWIGTLLLLLGGTGFSWGMLIAGNRGSVAAMGVWDSLHLLVSLTSAALLAWAAGRFFFEGQRNGQLELLLSTPLGARDIITGNWRALCRPLRGAWLLVAFLVLIEIITGAAGSGSLNLFQLTMAPVVRVLDIIALCWMGMWFGLTLRRPVAIMGWTVGLVVGLPWFISYVFIISASLGSNSGWNTTGAPVFILLWLVAWPLLNLAKNIFFIRWAARRLRAEFRATASLGVAEWTK
jgi:ABC-type transport system involved in multi-copper enzyme maturation permease subunit